MFIWRRKVLFTFFKLSDVGILIIALFLTSLFSTQYINQITLRQFFTLRIKLANLIGFLFMILAWHLLFKNFHLYCSQRLGNKLNECKNILKATTIGTVIFIFAGLLFKIKAFSPLYSLVFWLTSTILTILFRSVLRYSLKKIRLYGRNLRFVLIVGTNQRAYNYANMLEEKKELGYRLLGYIDKNINLPYERIKLLGSLEDFPAILKNNVIDEVVIALPIKSFYEEIQKIVRKVEEHGIIIRYLSNLFDTKIAQSKVEKFEDFTVLTIASGPLKFSFQYMIKGAIDILLSIALIIITSPLILFVSIAIKLTSSGPIFFTQERVGYNKRVFRLYKFRTMGVGTERMQAELEYMNEMDGPAFKIKDDPRVTKFGKWLRKTSIDELPQLLNVLKSEMSLVGPRPLPVRDYNGFSKDWQLRRFSVLPGITCTWQIKGRNDISFEDWMKLDMEYIDHWKLSNDLKILFETLPAVIRRNGAS